MKEETKAQGPEPLQEPYTLYDTCDTCTVAVYAELVCHDNLQALVASGHPPLEALQKARTALIGEFHERSGNSRTAALHNSIRKINLYKAQILGYTVAAQLIGTGNGQRAIAYLNRNGIRLKALPPEEEGLKSLLARVEAKSRQKRVMLREELARYRSIATGNARNGSGGRTGHKNRPAPQDFNDQLVRISKHVGFHLTKSITLAEYAGYLKEYRKYGSNNKQ